MVPVSSLSTHQIGMEKQTLSPQMEESASIGRRRNIFNGDAPHFIQTILEDDLRNKFLRIPRMFVERLRGALSDPVRLEVPTGRVWEVGLHRDDDGLYLRDGWADFLEDCHVGLGFLLLFRHEGDSSFFVVVFDVTTCEIEYPGRHDVSTRTGSVIAPMVSPPGIGKADKKSVKVEESNYNDSLGEPANVGRKKPILGSNRPLKRLRTVSSSQETRLQNSAIELREVRRPAEFCGKIASDEKSEAYLRASSFPCENTACVIKIRCLGCLHLPKRFLKACFPGRSEFSDIFCVSGGKSWALGINKSHSPRFRRGWTGFVADNNLSIGDACVFELMDRPEAKFQVVIFHNQRTALSCSSPLKLEPPCQETSSGESTSQTDSRKDNDSAKVDCTDEVCEEHPFFPIVITKTSARHSVHVPTTFAKNHLPSIQAGENVKAALEYGGLTWPVALYSRECCGSAYTMIKGWQKFRKGNGFQLGNVLRFELVGKEELVFRVSISNDAEGQ